MTALKQFGDKIEPKKSESGEKKPKIDFKSAPEPKPKTGGGGGGSRSQIDEAERMLATMRERITLNEQDLQSVDKMTAVEKESAKVKFQLETGTLKATEAQKQSILANFEQLAAQEKALIAQEEYRRGVEQLEQTNIKQSSVLCCAQLNTMQNFENKHEVHFAADITAVPRGHLRRSVPPSTHIVSTRHFHSRGRLYSAQSASSTALPSAPTASAGHAFSIILHES